MAARLKKSAKPRRVPEPQPNPRLNRQTRKVLLQHYRAKYGVK